MNQARFAEFASVLEKFTQEIICRFPDTENFVNYGKGIMLEKFPELKPQEESTFSSPLSREKKQIETIESTLERSVNNARRMCFHDLEIKRDTPEECLETINLLARAIGDVHRNVLYYASIQGEILLTLKDMTVKSFAALIRDSLDISRSHAYFLMNFHNLVLDYPRLLKCELPLRFFLKNFKDIKTICDADSTVWRS